MSDTIEINGKVYLPVRDAALEFGYSPAHITRLAKAKKIRAFQTGRMWFVGAVSLKNYLEDQQLEASVQKKLLRKQRQVELSLRGASNTNLAGGSFSVRGKLLTVVFVCVLFLVGVAAASGVTLGLSSTSVVALVSHTDKDKAPISVVDAEAIHPTFSDEPTVRVGSTDRLVVKPEVTPQWVQITP